jgi:hypothetical protein
MLIALTVVSFIVALVLGLSMLVLIKVIVKSKSILK